MLMYISIYIDGTAIGIYTFTNKKPKYMNSLIDLKEKYYHNKAGAVV